MNRFLIAGAAFLMAIPMAAKAVENTQEATTLSDSQLIPADQLNTLFSAQPEAPRFWVCVARDRIGRRFQAQDWSVQRAQRSALYTCRRNSPWGRCRLQGCAQYSNGGGHGGGWPGGGHDDGGHGGGWPGGGHDDGGGHGGGDHGGGGWPGGGDHGGDHGGGHGGHPVE